MYWKRKEKYMLDKTLTFSETEEYTDTEKVYLQDNRHHSIIHQPLLDPLGAAGPPRSCSSDNYLPACSLLAQSGGIPRLVQV